MANDRECSDCPAEDPRESAGFFDDVTACDEYRKMSRRAFLGRSKAVAASGIMTPAWLPTVVLGKGEKRNGVKPKTLVYVFLRGGPDVLSQIVCWTDLEFYALGYNNGSDDPFLGGLRPDTGQNPPTYQSYEYQNNNQRSLDIGNVNGDGFGINLAFADPNWGQQFNDRNSLFDAYHSPDGGVAWVLPAGSPDKNRSHFQAEQRVEYGTPNQPQTTFTGFLTRYLELGLTQPQGVLRAAVLAQNNLVPKVLAFGDKTLAFKDIDDVVFPGPTATIEPLIRRYQSETPGPLADAVANTFEVIELLAQVNTSPNLNAKYNGSDFGNRMENSAHLIKGDINIECLYTDLTGWDNHADQNPLQGQGGMYRRMTDLAQNLAAFRIDMIDAGKWDDVVVVVQGEFGRQNNWNDSGGTDHGNGGVMTVMGGKVESGVYSKRLDGNDGWPGLAPGPLQAVGQHDALPSTIDYRWVLTEIFTKCMGLDLATINASLLNTDDEVPPYAYEELGLINL